MEISMRTNSLSPAVHVVTETKVDDFRLLPTVVSHKDAVLSASNSTYVISHEPQFLLVRIRIVTKSIEDTLSRVGWELVDLLGDFVRDNHVITSYVVNLMRR